MILIRFVLVSLIIYLIIRSFTKFVEGEKHSAPRHEPEKSSKVTNKGVSKEIGEYIDYEEVDK